MTATDDSACGPPVPAQARSGCLGKLWRALIPIALISAIPALVFRDENQTRKTIERLTENVHSAPSSGAEQAAVTAIWNWLWDEDASYMVSVRNRQTGGLIPVNSILGSRSGASVYLEIQWGCRFWRPKMMLLNP